MKRIGKVICRTMRILLGFFIVSSLAMALIACGSEIEEDGETEFTAFDGVDLPVLMLYADKTMFNADEERELFLTVRIPSEYSFSTIIISDEKAGLVTAITEDLPAVVAEDYREYVAYVTLDLEKGESGMVSLTAYMADSDSGEEGKLKSNPLEIYCTGR